MTTAKDAQQNKLCVFCYKNKKTLKIIKYLCKTVSNEAQKKGG